MAMFDADSRKRLFDYLQNSFDADNAADMEAFTRNFLHNGAVWDMLADHFPTASASVMRSVMLEAFAEWCRQRDGRA